MQSLLISDLSFLELLTQETQQQIIGGNSSLTITVSGSNSQTRPIFIYAISATNFKPSFNPQSSLRKIKNTQNFILKTIKNIKFVKPVRIR